MELLLTIQEILCESAVYRYAASLALHGAEPNYRHVGGVAPIQLGCCFKTYMKILSKLLKIHKKQEVHPEIHIKLPHLPPNQITY